MNRQIDNAMGPMRANQGKAIVNIDEQRTDKAKTIFGPIFMDKYPPGISVIK